MYKKLIGVVICITLLCMINSATASLIDVPITKNGITVTLLENTDYCETKCYSIYEICYNEANKLNSDLNISFKSEKDKMLEPVDYLERYEIEPGETSSCRKLTVHGKKGIFEVVDNIPSIKGTVFEEFTIWNSTYPFRTEINFTIDISDGLEYAVNDTNGINGSIVWTKKVAESSYIYCTVSNCSADFLIGNETDVLDFEIESLNGSNPTNVWSDVITMWHYANIDGSNTSDSSPTDYNLELINTPTLNASGVFGNAFNFDSDSDEALEQSGWNFVNGNEAITICAWANMIDCSDRPAEAWCRVIEIGSAVGDQMHIISTFSDQDRWSFGAYGGNLDSGIDIVKGQWYHLCQVHYANGTTIGYVNGTETVSGSITFALPNPTLVASGHGYGTVDNEWNGQIDDVRVYNRTLDPIDILGLYYNGIDNLTIEGVQQVFSLINNASGLFHQFNISDFTTSSTTPQTLINVTFNTTQPFNAYGLLFTTNCQRITGLSNFITTEIYFDGVLIDTKRVCSVNSVGDITSGGTFPDGAILGSGQHEIAMKFNISAVGSVNISNIDLLMIQAFDNNNQVLDATKYNIDGLNFNSTSFVSIFNFTSRNASSIFPLTVNTSTAVLVQFSAITTGIDAVEMYIQNLNSGTIFPYGVFSFETASAVRSGSLTFVDEFKDIVPINYTLFARTNNGETITLEGFARTNNLKDAQNGTLGTFFVTNNLTNLTSSLLLNEGTNLIMNKSVTVFNGTNFFISLYASVNSTSGAQTPRFYVNSTNTGQCTQKFRYMPSNDAYGWIYAVFLCNNLTVGEVANFMVYVDVEAGETLRLLDEALSGAEAEIFDISELPLPPIETIILEPENNSVLFGIGRISIIPYFDPNDDPVTYTYALFNKTGDFNKTISASTSSTNISINWTQEEQGDYDLVVEGCDNTGLCANNISANITVTVPPIPPPPEPPTPFNASSVSCFSEDFLLIVDVQQNTSIISNSTNVTISETREFLSCAYGCDFYNNRCRDDPITRMVVLMLFIIYMATISILPLILLTRQTKKKKLKLIIDFFTLFVFVIVYFVTLTFLSAPFISLIGFDVTTAVLVLMFSLFMFVMFMLLLIINNMMKERYT